MHKVRIFFIAVFVLVAFVIIGIIVCNKVIDAAAKGKLYSSTKSIPYNKVALLLGTSKYMGANGINPYYQYRINAAAELYKAGKIKYIIASGANNTKEYNEPKWMRDDLVKQGVDSSHIFLDYAGLRTFDSMVRLKKIFDQDTVTVISQQFHNERALFIGAKEGITAIGFNARDVRSGDYNGREIFARVKVFLDFLTGNEPKFLGPKVHIP